MSTRSELAAQIEALRDEMSNLKWLDNPNYDSQVEGLTDAMTRLYAQLDALPDDDEDDDLIDVNDEE